MKVDIREKIKREKMLRELSEDHRSIFEKKLQKELHTKAVLPKRYLSIAAAVIMIFSVGYLITQSSQTPRQQLEPKVSKVNIEEYSPELKKIENYYLTAISFEMSKLEMTDENKAVLDEYFNRMKLLTQEYEKQIEQLDYDKIDETLINNMIDNLQQRLNLMIELKKELKKLKSKENEELTV